ncbi:MAG TPA: HPP family protein [Conexibacter sp.]|jgi:CBS domain-containing membrane protein
MTPETRTASRPRGSRSWQPFAPILAGATARDRALACAGALVGIALVGLCGALIHGDSAALPWIVAPMGASAVLLFAVPASPMAQPWPVIGGNAVSAAVGLGVGHAVHDATVAVALAAGLAIGAMSLARCLHPPGGAAAITAAMGGPAVGHFFPLAPVGVNAVLLVATGWLFHRLVSGHSYPHVPPPAPVGASGTADLPPAERVGFRAEDVDAVLREIGDAFDISAGDLALLVREVEARALVREHGEISCAEIMSRDVISIARDADPAAARDLLLERGVRLLPVLDASGHVVGGVGLRELARARPGRVVGDVMADAITVTPDRPAIELTGQLTDGRHHAAMVIDPNRRLIGLVTQADLLAAVTRQLDRQEPG